MCFEIGAYARYVPIMLRFENLGKVINNDLFAGLIWQIVAYLPDNIRQRVSYSRLPKWYDFSVLV